MSVIYRKYMGFRTAFTLIGAVFFVYGYAYKIYWSLWLGVILWIAAIYIGVKKCSCPKCGSTSVINLLRTKENMIECPKCEEKIKLL